MYVTHVALSRPATNPPPTNPHTPTHGPDDIRSLASKLTSKPAVAFLFDVSAAVVGMTALSGGLSGGLSVASNTAFLVSRFLDGSTTDADCKRAAAIMMGAQGGAEGGGEEGAKKGGAKTAGGHQHPPFQRV